jgi:hypothetical protein
MQRHGNARQAQQETDDETISAASCHAARCIRGKRLTVPDKPEQTKSEESK